ncbi:MBL fold metallo-hydrolase [Rossellomorea aquimaris]|uniref:MBL fold metallo-hydrolase n=1 Tax=Rossellomorea aquimaris TaxID=189382 RepID=UPI001CD531B7|nr:MBL fold metallo-hydrolase [Rossellomorea aquimaris]MCA1054815.1 MBL fold metallo-hydrolase [Rossellomorea aquimaris]
MQWKRMPLGPLQTNCYILWDDANRCLIIDPGAEGEKLVSWLDAQNLKPVAILLTHAHFDHIGAVDTVRNTYHVPVYLHEKEAEWLIDPGLNGSGLFGMGNIQTAPADHLLSSEKTLSIGGFTLGLFETPGHSPGSLSYYVQSEGIVFAGDTLFMGSIGRSDLPGGNHEQLLSSIHDHLLTLPESTAVLPGHGPETTVGEEMDGNPFLNGF